MTYDVSFFPSAFLRWRHWPEVQSSPVPSGEFTLNSHSVTLSRPLVQPVRKWFDQADTKHYLLFLWVSVQSQRCTVGLKYFKHKKCRVCFDYFASISHLFALTLNQINSRANLSHFAPHKPPTSVTSAIFSTISILVTTDWWYKAAAAL